MSKIRLEQSQIWILFILAILLVVNAFNDGWFYHRKTYCYDSSKQTQKPIIIGTDFLHTGGFYDDCLFISINHKEKADITLIVQSTKDEKVLFKLRHKLPASHNAKYYTDWAHIPADVEEVMFTCISNGENSDATIKIQTTDSCYY